MLNALRVTAAKSPTVDLVFYRRQDLFDQNPDYHVVAGALLVGRIIRMSADDWHWRIVGLETDGAVRAGSARDVETAEALLRAEFNDWLTWALSVRRNAYVFQTLRQQLAAIGAI